MENLWKKEENQSQYVNLFASFLEEDSRSTADQPNPLIKLDQSQKNNQRSTELRSVGNEKFLSGNVFDAIRYYNKSLCFAEIGSENVAQAFVNRSACFSRLKMHSKAFRDIELAKNANLPDRMRSKVEQRENECRKLMNCVEKRANCLPKLSYDADENYSCMANVLEIAQNDVFGRHIVAKCDIPVGKIVLLEECFVACTKNDDHDMCYTCFRQMENFIACPHCPDVLFCSLECLNQNLIHKWECGTPSIANHIEIKLTLVAILKAIDAFSSVDNLMAFVEDVLCDDDHDLKKLPASVGHDAKSMFHFYFKLTKTAKYHDQLLFNINRAYNSILAIRKVADLFDSKEKQRFLMHFIAHIYYINRANAIGSETIRRVINVFSLINHSCSPNLYTRYTGKIHHCITTRPVRKGEQLFINYLGTQKQTMNERHDELKSKWDFTCNCDKCRPRCKSTDRKKVVADPTYKFITENYKNGDNSPVILGECESFLNKFAHANWSKEIEAISEIYRSALILDNLKNTL